MTQSNTATNTATASNANDTTQALDQGQAGGGSGTQQGYLVNYTKQRANGQVVNIQANIYAPVTVFGSSVAGLGAVSQSNHSDQHGDVDERQQAGPAPDARDGHLRVPLLSGA